MRLQHPPVADPRRPVARRGLSLLAFALACACDSPPDSPAPSRSRAVAPAAATAAPQGGRAAVAEVGARERPGASEDGVPEGFRRSPPARVRRVHDGDTLVLDDGRRVRLLGIDAPELDAEGIVARELAARAGAELRRLAEARDVTLLVGFPSEDRYGRTLAYVELATGGREADLGARLLASGHAQVYASAHPRLAAYRALERAAREAERGLWIDAGRQALALDAEATVDAADAASHVGRRVRVVGTVVRVGSSKAGVFVDFGPTRADFTAVIWRSMVPSFEEDPRGWTGRRLAVTGLVKEHEGSPEMILDSPDQVERLE